MPGKLLSFFFADLSFVLQVAFVANKDFADIIISEPFNLLHPLSDILKGFSICHIIDYNYTMGTSIIACCQCPESLLASSIPYL